MLIRFAFYNIKKVNNINQIYKKPRLQQLRCLSATKIAKINIKTEVITEPI